MPNPASIRGWVLLDLPKHPSYYLRSQTEEATMQTETTTDWLADILITPATTERTETQQSTEAAACSGHCSSGICRTA